MNRNSDKLFSNWSERRKKIEQTLFRAPQKLNEKLWVKNGLWIAEKDCPLHEGVHHAYADSQCARISSLTAEYKIGAPHEKLVHTGFRIETGKRVNKWYKLYCFPDQGLGWEVRNIGPTWYLNTSRYARKIIVHLILNNLLAQHQIKYIVPKLITSYQCGVNRYALIGHFHNQMHPFDYEINEDGRTFISQQLDYLYKILSAYQWYEPNLKDNLFIVPLGTETLNININGTIYTGSYQLCYFPSTMVEIKIALDGGEDLFIAPRPHAELTSTKIDYQKQTLVKYTIK